MRQCFTLIGSYNWIKTVYYDGDGSSPLTFDEIQMSTGSVEVDAIATSAISSTGGLGEPNKNSQKEEYVLALQRVQAREVL